MIKAQNLRNKVTNIFHGDELFDHQREAAQKTFNALTGDVRAVVMAAEMQAGKSGISLALSCLQRLSMSDEDICNRTKLKDTLYLLTMPDTALLDQAMKDLDVAKNAVVSNFNRFEQDLERYFKGKAPKLIIIDECHYGSNARAVRYCRVFDYLEKENDDCKVVFISATPFGALYAAEQEYDLAKHIENTAIKNNNQERARQAALAAEYASKEAILRRDFNTRLVFHRTSEEYFGVREMLKLGKVSNLDRDSRNFTIPSDQRNQIVNMIEQHEGAGWVLVRVPAGTAMDAKNYFVDIGLPQNNVFILGNQLSGVPEEEHTSIDQFKREFDECIDFDEKLIAITVAGFRAGINFGHEMKSHLIATWDSTVTSIASVVQANVGRACGYHDNQNAHHFTNIDAVEAYAEILNYLEANTFEHAASDFDGLRDFFDGVCEEYDVNGLDVGLTVKYKKRRPIADVETYMTDSYIVVPGKLFEPEFTYDDYTDDPVTLKAISLLKEELTKNGGPSVKSNRAMRGAKKNWVKAQWVNGDTYDNKEKARKDGTMKERTFKFTDLIDQGEELEFNQVVQPGSGEYTEAKIITATVFSVYNLSRRSGVKKRIMTTKDVHDVCDHFDVEYDDTLFVLYKRGVYDVDRTELKIANNQGPDVLSTINDESQFSETKRN